MRIQENARSAGIFGSFSVCCYLMKLYFRIWYLGLLLDFHASFLKLYVNVCNCQPCLKMSLQHFKVIYVYKAYWFAPEPEMCHSNEVAVPCLRISNTIKRHTLFGS